MTVFEFTDYRKFLLAAVQHLKRKDASLSFSSLAVAAKVQRSYLSQVLNRGGYLNADQAYLIAKRLKLSEPETRYFELLVEVDRCQLSERKARLLAELERLKTQSQKTESVLKREKVEIAPDFLTTYYSDPRVPIVHMMLTVDHYSRDTQLIARRLRLTSKKVQEILSVLENCRLIEWKGDQIVVLKSFLHLPVDSPLHRIHSSFFRMKAIESIQDKREDDDFFFTSSFSATPAIKKRLKEKFLKLIQAASKEIEATDPTEVYHLNFDLFCP